MWDHAADQIEAIHSMMDRGARSVCMERHSLYLWGVGAALLILVVRQVFTPEWFPVIWQRSLLSNLFIAALLILIGVWDFRLTRRARAARDETLSFIQVQLTKVWWGIIALVVLINIGMNFFGGGYLFYPIMIALIGLAFFIHGLFSQQLLSWVGMLMVLIGLLSMALRLAFPTLEWMTVVIFGVGFPALALLLNWRPAWLKHNYRLVFTILWLSIITLPTYGLDRLYQRQAVPAHAVELLQNYLSLPTNTTNTRIVRLPAGTRVPIEVHIHGDVLADEAVSAVSVQLSRSIDIVLQDGKPNGQYRVEQGGWVDPRYKFQIQNTRIESSLTPTDGPKVNVSFSICTQP
ncbi:MAG: hypothetical protein HY080_15050 [Gammaproteobacteria bacterium]|nr:hypothetical protein [Gammaproteobacteria bacterium]